MIEYLIVLGLVIWAMSELLVGIVLVVGVLVLIGAALLRR